ncbi:MAG: HlyD family efflux transporter periplasmic adaptor subunit [Desulfobacterales bacterium]
MKNSPSEQESAPQKISIQQFLQIPWMGLRTDLILYPGPTDFDGQRSWILEDPVRGNNFRLGHAEGELIYRLGNLPDPDAAVEHLYRTTPLRPSLQEVVNFVTMLQRESLAVLPAEAVIDREKQKKDMEAPGFFQQIMRGNIYFRIPLLRPDRFLNRTLPWVSLLWSPVLRWMYLFCGLAGLTLTLQEIELYLKTVNYLFTPQGWLCFILCLGLLKTGHEFAHAYTAKHLGLHIRSIGVLFIVIWPLFYTDTTDVWKVPDRRRRIWVSMAGVTFELVVAGIALLLWALLPDGIVRSLMFFLSGTSILSSVFINLNPFMRYDGYYVLMDLWGVDNLRPRASAMLRHAMRRLFLDWKGPAPEIHPKQRSLIVYGLLAALYRISVGISIALAVYWLFFPMLGLIIFAAEIWLFIFFPLWMEIRAVMVQRKFLGSKFRLMLSSLLFLTVFAMLVLPLPHTEDVPALLVHKDASEMKAQVPGELLMDLPEEGKEVKEGELLARIASDALEYEMRQAKFDLEGVRAAIRSLGSGGEQGAHRKWLIAEEQRLRTSVEKYRQALAQLEIRAPISGRIADVNPDLYKGAFVAKDTRLFTVADPKSFEIKAFVHEKFIADLNASEILQTHVRFAGPELPELEADFAGKSLFPVQRLPNNSLFDFSGGPIVSVRDMFGVRPRDAYFAFTFKVKQTPEQFPHGLPAWMKIRTAEKSFLGDAVSKIWKHMLERGFF